MVQLLQTHAVQQNIAQNESHFSIIFESEVLGLNTSLSVEQADSVEWDDLSKCEGAPWSLLLNKRSNTHVVECISFSHEPFAKLIFGMF